MSGALLSSIGLYHHKYVIVGCKILDYAGQISKGESIGAFLFRQDLGVTAIAKFKANGGKVTAV